MKPTITNAFTVATTSGSSARAAGSHSNAPGRGGKRARGQRRDASGESAMPNARAVSVMLVPMQADLREAEFGFSLELSPIQAVDAVNALIGVCPPCAQFLVSMEQTAWRDRDAGARLAAIMGWLGLEAIEILTPDQAVLDARTLQSLAAITQPLRLLIVAVDGAIESRDATACNRAIEAGRSPLVMEIRAVAALEVLGDRSAVLHARQRETALSLVAQNFRHYLSAIMDKPVGSFAAPETGQIDGLLSETGALTVRPRETVVQGSSIDVGVNTSLERFNQPAGQSLVYDRPSNSWHSDGA